MECGGHEPLFTLKVCVFGAEGGELGEDVGRDRGDLKRGLLIYLL